MHSIEPNVRFNDNETVSVHSLEALRRPADQRLGMIRKGFWCPRAKRLHNNTILHDLDAARGNAEKHVAHWSYRTQWPEGRDVLRDLMGIRRGRDAGAEVEELPDALLPGEEADGAAEEGPGIPADATMSGSRAIASSPATRSASKWSLPPSH